MSAARKLYNWVIKWAKTPQALWALFCIAICESIFFPIPPDVLLIAMAVAMPKKAFKYGAVCLIGSVIGGLIGYGIGAAFMDSIGMPIIEFYHANTDFLKLQAKYNDNAAAILFISGFTPVPYKVFTLSSGAFNVSPFLFLSLSIISRGARFFLVAWLIYKFGARIENWINKYFNILTILFTILLIGGIIIGKWVF